MRIQKKILSLGLATLAALAGGAGRPAASAGAPLGADRPAARVVAAKAGSATFGTTNYENIIAGGYATQTGQKITAHFSGLRYNEVYNFALCFGGNPLSSTNPMRISFTFDTNAGFRETASLELRASPSSTGQTDTTGNLKAVYEDGVYGFIYKVPHTMGGNVDITIDLGGTGAYLSRMSAYKGPSYRGYIPFTGDVDKIENTYQVSENGKVEIVASPIDPVEPSDLLNGLIAYDEYEERWIYPQPDGTSLEDYAAKLLAGFKVGDIVSVRFKATDDSDNTTYINVTIHYQDLSAPAIGVDTADEANMVRLPYSRARTLAEAQSAIADLATVVDDLRPGIAPEVNIEGYEPFKIGTFPLVIAASDGYNRTEWEGTVLIYDNVQPEIDGPSTITTAVTAPLTSEGLIDLFTIVDEIDGEDVDVSLENDEYHSGSNTVKVGTYTATIVAYDAAGNRTEKEIRIEVEDQEGPVWFVYGSTLTVMEGSELSPMEVVDRLVAENSLERLDYVRAEIIQGGAIDGSYAPGSYRLVIRAQTADGQTRYAGVTLKVVAQSQLGLDPNPPKRTNSFFQFFIDIWNSIVNFFNKLFGKA